MDKKFIVNTDSFNGDNKHIRPSQYTVYTDGSKLDEGVRNMLRFPNVFIKSIA